MYDLSESYFSFLQVTIYIKNTQLTLYTFFFCVWEYFGESNNNMAIKKNTTNQFCHPAAQTLPQQTPTERLHV